MEFKGFAGFPILRIVSYATSAVERDKEVKEKSKWTRQDSNGTSNCRL